jgi:hypothetical protein
MHIAYLFTVSEFTESGSWAVAARLSSLVKKLNIEVELSKTSLRD